MNAANYNWTEPINRASDKPGEIHKEGSFRCDMTAISALETLLSDFLDSFFRHFGE
jgi:hypothetical protein